MTEPINDLAARLPETRVEPAPARLVVVSKRLWKLLLVIGGAIWILAAAVAEITDDHVLVPLVVNLGSFLVPEYALVAFALSAPPRGVSHDRADRARIPRRRHSGRDDDRTARDVPAARDDRHVHRRGDRRGDPGKGAVLVERSHSSCPAATRGTAWCWARSSVRASPRSRARATRSRRCSIASMRARSSTSSESREATRALLAPFGHITCDCAARWRALRELPGKRVVPRDVPAGPDVRGRRRAARAVGPRPTAGPSCSPKPRPGPTSWSLGRMPRPGTACPRPRSSCSTTWSTTP